jgi:hypothetical protein
MDVFLKKNVAISGAIRQYGAGHRPGHYAAVHPLWWVLLAGGRAARVVLLDAVCRR